MYQLYTTSTDRKGKALREKTGRLDLGRCGLTELPDALFELEWWEEWILADDYWDDEEEEWVGSQNEGQSNDMIEALELLASFLARNPLTVEEVIKQLGTVISDYKPNVLLKPSDPLFKEANIVRQIDLTSFEPSNTPAHVLLTPLEPPTIETLAQTFGRYRRIPAEENFPPRVIFYLDMPDQPYTVTLIADVRQGYAVEIALRRDIRL